MQPHKTDYFTAIFARLHQNELYASWFANVFTLHYLPGRIFVIAPAKTIDALRTLAGIKSKPWRVPLSEWDARYSSPLFRPWSRRHINVRSWVRISEKKISYYGDVAYVLGSAGTTDGLVVAIVPRIRRPSVREGGETSKQKGKRPVRVNTKDTTLALFELDGMIALDQTAVKTTPVDKNNFVNVLQDLLVNQVTAHDSPDLAGFDWADLPIVPGASVYQFDGQLFYRGLLLLPLWAFDTVTVVTAPTSDEIIPFAQSHIDPLHIDNLLSQLHWRPGDRVSRGDDIYKLEDVQLDNGSVLASPVQFQPTEELAMVQIPMDELQRRFFIGDAVVVLAGVHQGATGSVLSEEDGILNLLTGDDGTYVSMLVKMHQHQLY